MLRTLSSTQIADWMAYDLVEPFGTRAEDLRGATLTTAIVNRLRGSDERGHRLDEFLLIKPVDPEPDEEQVMRDLKTYLRPTPLE